MDSGNIVIQPHCTMMFLLSHAEFFSLLTVAFEGSVVRLCWLSCWEMWEQTVVFWADIVTAKISPFLTSAALTYILTCLSLVHSVSTADTSSSSELTLRCHRAAFQLSGLPFADRMTLQLGKSCFVLVTWLKWAPLTLKGFRSVDYCKMQTYT